MDWTGPQWPRMPDPSSHPYLPKNKSDTTPLEGLGAAEGSRAGAVGDEGHPESDLLGQYGARGTGCLPKGKVTNPLVIRRSFRAVSDVSFILTQKNPSPCHAHTCMHTDTYPHLSLPY